MSAIHNPAWMTWPQTNAANALMKPGVNNDINTVHGLPWSDVCVATNIYGAAMNAAAMAAQECAGLWCRFGKDEECELGIQVDVVIGDGLHIGFDTVVDAFRDEDVEKFGRLINTVCALAPKLPRDAEVGLWRTSAGVAGVGSQLAPAFANAIPAGMSLTALANQQGRRVFIRKK